MPLSNDSSEISPSLAELTTQLIPAATTLSQTQSTPTPPTAVAASDGTDRPVFPVTILGPTNSSNQAPPNRRNDDDADVHTTRHHDNVTLRSSDANRQQTRHNGDPDRDDDDDDTNPRRRIDSPPQRYLCRQGLDSYDNSTRRNNPFDRDATGDYPPTPNQQSGSEDGGDGNHRDNRQRNDSNQHQYNDDNRNNNDYRRFNDDNQSHNDNRRNYDDSNPPRDNRNTGPSYETEHRNDNRQRGTSI